MKREPTRLTLTDNEIADMIANLETRKFEEQMKASKLLEQRRSNMQPLEIDSSNIFGIRSMDNFNDDISQGNKEYPKSIHLNNEKIIQHTRNIPNHITADTTSYNNGQFASEVDRLDIDQNLVQSHGSETDNNGTNRSSLTTYPSYSQQSGTATNYIRNISASSNVSDSRLDESEDIFDDTNSPNQPNPFYMPDH